MLPTHHTIKHNGKEVNGKSVFILGNSHPQCAINDSFLDRHMMNLAQGGEPLFYTAVKANEILKNTNADTIVIEFTNNSLTTIDWVLDDNRLLDAYQKHFPNMTLAQQEFLFRNNFSKSLKAIMFMDPVKLIRYDQLDGGYRANEKVADFRAISEVQERAGINKNKSYREVLENQNPESLYRLIRENPSIRFILTRLPMHHTYPLTNEIQFQHFVQKMTSEENCTFIDFHKAVTLPDSCFMDYEHLNRTGAAVFTPIFDSVIRGSRSLIKR
jgi:hypothetical protein